MANLIVNAAHAIKERSGDSSPKAGRIIVRTAILEEWVEIRISDNGAGIPAVIRDRIFEPFFTTKEIGRGTGQGLAIVHSVVTLRHHGLIDVESEQGVGTTFIIRLPLSRERQAVDA